MTTTVSLSFAALTIDSADPAALADFWGSGARPSAARSARARSPETRRSTPPAPTAAPG
jgi:hypothetical protein